MIDNVIFFLFLALGILLMLAIIAVTFAIYSLLRNEHYLKYLFDGKKAKNKKSSCDYKSSISWFFLAVPSVDLINNVDTLTILINNLPLLCIISIDIVLLFLLICLSKVFRGLLKIQIDNNEGHESTAQNIYNFITDIAPIKEEEKILLDHEYDGIRELDNNLPPWWLWGFYFTIFIAFIYLFHYHVFKTGDLQEVSYKKEITMSENEIKAYLIKNKMTVNEFTATYLESMYDLKKGESIYLQYCKICHGNFGEGQVGPNLTDEYWIKGSGINNIFKTIKYGSDNGMKSWKDELNPLEIQQVSSYIISLNGSDPPNAKAPQGELITDNN